MPRTFDPESHGSRFHADPMTTEREARILDSAARLLAEVQLEDMREFLQETSVDAEANACADTEPAPAPTEG